MGSLNSLMLWSGMAVAGVTVPIVIHLLYRKHRRQTNWAAMELLRRAIVIRSGQVKLEDYLILFLRCLALFLIAFSMWRPTVNSQWLGQERVGMVVAIDVSYSMNHGEFSRLEKAIDKAKEILETAEQGQPVTLVLMSNRPKILLRRTGYDPSLFEDLLDEQQSASPYRLSLERNLEQIEELVDELKTPTRECYLITDGQELDWGEMSDRASETLRRLTKTANVFVVPVKVDSEANLSLTELAYSSGSLQQSGVARFTAMVRNEGPRPTDGGNVEFYVGDAQITRRAVGSLKPGETRGVSFFASFDKPGDTRLRAHLSKDDLTEDNDRFAVVNIRPSIRVLCVDDEPLSDTQASRTGVYYAVRAIRGLRRDVDSPLQVSETKAADLSLEDLSKYDVILMANVADVAPEMVQRIDRFVRGGGGLILFLGNKVKAKLYNERFGSGKGGLLPGELGKTLAVDEGQRGWALGPVRSEHSLAKVAARLSQKMIDKALIEKIVQVTPAPESQTILTLAEPAAPLLLSRDVGAGSVLMFTTSADRTWSKWLAIHPLYIMLLKQAVTNMTSHPEARKTIVGEPAEFAVRGRQVGDSIRLTDPEGQTTELKVTQAGELPVAAIDTRQVGVYGVYEVTADADTPAITSAITTIAANVDPAESNVRVVKDDVLADRLEPLGIHVIPPADALAGEIKGRRQGRELANLLLMCGIFAFVLQSVLAKYFTNRMSHADTDVSASLQLSRVAAARRS